MKKLVRNLIIGKRNYIESWCEFKQVMLSGQYLMISILACIFYALIDVFLLGTLVTLPVYIVALGLFGLAWYQHRKGNHCEANYFLFPTLVVVVYLVSASESPSSGGYIHFIPIVLGGFAVFDYKKRLIAIFIACATYVFFSLSFFTEFSLLPKHYYTEEQDTINLILNFSVAMPASILAIYLFIQL